MRFAIATVLAAASVATAATSAAAAAPTGDGSVCAQDIVDACVDGYDRQIEKCKGNDYICLCDNYSNKLVCYNNCPNSQDRPPVQNQVTQFCNAAKPLSSASLASVKSAMSAAKTASAAATTAEASATDSSATPTVAEASGFQSENTGAASTMQVPVGGAFAVVLGLAGLL